MYVHMYFIPHLGEKITGSSKRRRVIPELARLMRCVTVVCVKLWYLCWVSTVNGVTRKCGVALLLWCC